MNKNKILIGAIILLVVANVATMLMFWLKRPPEVKFLGRAPSEFISEELSLDSKQKEQYQALVFDHRKKMDQIKDTMEKARGNFQQLLTVPSVDDSTINAAEKKVVELMPQFDMLMFDHLKKLRAICTPEQQKRFDQMIQMFWMMIFPPDYNPRPSGKGPIPNRPPPPPGDHHEPPPPQ